MEKKEKKLLEGRDYILNEQGQMVFTEYFHKNRGHCCESGCKNCPYGYSEKVNPEVPSEFQSPWDEKIQIYEGDIPPDEEL